MAPLEIRKTYKLYVGGEFVRSESGHYDEALDGKGRHRANLCRASRKDLRDAVVKARAVQEKWASQSGYLRGQILYRMAEMMESRVPAFESALRGSGLSAAAARGEVRATIDRIVHFAGWSDKYQALLSSVNPVASSYFDFSLPEPTGVVGVVAPGSPALLGLVSHVLPVIVSGNSCVVLLSESFKSITYSLFGVEQFAWVSGPAGAWASLVALGAIVWVLVKIPLDNARPSAA